MDGSSDVDAATRRTEPPPCALELLAPADEFRTVMKVLTTKEAFDKAVKKSKHQLTVVDFTATWCGPCQQVAPVFERMAEEMPSVAFFKCDVDENEEAAEECQITAMPTFQLYLRKKLCAQIQGADMKSLYSAVMDALATLEKESAQGKAAEADDVAAGAARATMEAEAAVEIPTEKQKRRSQPRGVESCRPEAAEKTEKKKKKTRDEGESQTESGPTEHLSKRARKEARKAAAGDAPPESKEAREAATAAFLAKREAAEAARVDALAKKRAEVEAKREAAAGKTKKAAPKAAQPPVATEATTGDDGGGSTKKAGDWTCGECGASCFASRSHCFKCGAAGGSAGFDVRPGDWRCGGCGANVFASKAACFRCGLAKGEEGGGEGAAAPTTSWQQSRAAGAPASGGLADDDGLTDVSATCKDCSAAFVVSAGEQRFFKQKGFQVCVRARCTSCTAAKKARFGDRYGVGGSGSGAGGSVSSGGAAAGGTVKCYNCQKVGHMSRDCPEERRAFKCFLCGEDGHSSGRCPNNPKGSGCFHCGALGHLSRDCKTVGANACFRCGKQGHMSSQCKEPPKASRPAL